MTHRQLAVWGLFLQGTRMEPSLTDMYLMQVAWSAYYANAQKRPAFDSKEWTLRAKEEQARTVDELPDSEKPPILRGLVKKKPPSLAEQQAAIAKGRWMAAAAADGPIRGLPLDHPMQEFHRRRKASGGGRDRT